MTMDDAMQRDNGPDNAQPVPEPANDDNATPATAEPGIEQRLAAAQSELAETKDRLLRAMAEVENVRRRAQREKDDAVKYAAGNFARELLTVADNLGRALASAPEEKIRDEVMKSLLAGVAATERELAAVFERNGIRRIRPKGERFDHNFHQAIFEAENTGQPPGTIVEVLQDGYVLHDRLLRPAMVGVAKGGAAAPRPEPGERIDTVV